VTCLEQDEPQTGFSSAPTPLWLLLVTWRLQALHVRGVWLHLQAAETGGEAIW
jgi:hypothetical protein